MMIDIEKRNKALYEVRPVENLIKNPHCLKGTSHVQKSLLQENRKTMNMSNRKKPFDL